MRALKMITLPQVAAGAVTAGVLHYRDYKDKKDKKTKKLEK